jgi:D-serine deaminase-like pyridoxal phosphate-dependent protein
VRITELRTPQVLIDARRLSANINRMQSMVSDAGMSLRPHAKTHKIPQIARWQLERGAVGICCAKVGEAEVFAEAGISDIRLPYPVNPANTDRVLALARRARISLIVDDLEVAAEWSRRVSAAGERLDVLIKVDVGFHRCGIDPDRIDARGFVRSVAAMPGLRLRGLLSHAGHGYGAKSDEELRAIAAREAVILRSLADAVTSADGLAIEEISVGATPTARFSARERGVTEMRPGNYVYFDRSQAGLGAARFADCALTVLAMVVSRPAPDRIVLDCGSKTLSSDQARGWIPAPGYGAILRDLESSEPDPSLLIERLSEEHAVVQITGPSPAAVRTGDLVRVVPNHACVVSNLVDCVRLVDGIVVTDTLAVAARGKIV